MKNDTLLVCFFIGCCILRFFHEIKIVIASLYAGLFYLPTKNTVFWVLLLKSGWTTFVLCKAIKRCGKSKKMKIYIALDGDNVGTKLHDLILQGCDEKVSVFAKGVATEMANYAASVEKLGANVLLCSGDSVLYTIEQESEKAALEALNVSFCTYTIGIGRNMKEAHLMLNYGKFLGKNRVHRFDSVSPSWFRFQFCGFFISAYKFILKNK